MPDRRDSAQPHLSVCVPVYNGRSSLPATLRSLADQTRPPDEIVIVDDGSTDDSVQIARDLAPSATISQLGTNQGAAVAWNTAVDASSNPWVKLLCQDDVLHPDALERQLAVAASASPSCVLVASRRRIVDAFDRELFAARGLGRLRGQQTGEAVRNEILHKGSNILGEPSAVLFRRETFEKTDGFDPAAAYTIDVDMWLRLLEFGGAWCDPDVICDFRVSADQWSVRLAHQQADEMNTLLERLAERQNAPFRASTAKLRSSVDVTARRLLYWNLARQSRDRSSESQ